MGGRRQRSPFWSRVSVSSDFSKTMASRSVLYARVSPPAVTAALWRTLIMAYDLACVGGRVASCAVQTQRANTVSSTEGLGAGAAGAAGSPGGKGRRLPASQGVKKRGGGLESCYALDLHRNEGGHPPPQLDHQTVHGDPYEVLLAHLRRVTGPGSAAEVGQWPGALVQGLAAPLLLSSSTPCDPRPRKVFVRVGAWPSSSPSPSSPAAFTAAPCECCRWRLTQRNTSPRVCSPGAGAGDRTRLPGKLHTIDFMST